MNPNQRKRPLRAVQWLTISILLAMTAWIMSGMDLFSARSAAAAPSSLSYPVLHPASSSNTSDPPPENHPSIPQPLSQRMVEYHISVELKSKQHMLYGTESLTWTNPAKKALDTVYFHMYPNAFESMKTTFMKESGGKLRSDKMTPDSFGYMKIASAKTIGGSDLLHTMTYVQPDDHNPDDHTLIQLKLPTPVMPHAKTTLIMKFQVKLPKAFARMGYVGDYVMAGQWFPKIAVYNPPGTQGHSEGGWNLHQYHGNSEFYADFGVYDVRIGVPEDDIVAATGFPTHAPVVKNKVKWYHYYADDVHDFAWSASPHFMYAEQKLSGVNLPGVKLKLYLDPSQKNLKDRYFQAARHALLDYCKWYGEYPYSTLSIVVPPRGGNGTGGMEYPTLVTAWAADNSHPDLDLERVVVHEIGHQFFYGMLASNEFEEAWLDEGFTTYAESRVMAKDYGVKDALSAEATYITNPEALNQSAWKYAGYGSYAENVYTRSKLVLLAVEQQIGQQKMDHVLRLYFMKWRFRHPSTQDFLQVLNRVTDKNWSHFFKQFVSGAEMSDYTVQSIRAAAVKGNGQSMIRSTVLITRQGGWYRPVQVKFHFKDGRTIEKEWDGQKNQIRFRLLYSVPVDWVDVDPSHAVLLDNRPINNFLKTNISSAWAARWNLGSTKLIETVLNWFAW